MSEESETTETFKETLRVTLEQSGRIMDPNTALEIAEIVLMTSAEYLERTAPYAKRTISALRAAADSISVDIEE